MHAWSAYWITCPDCPAPVAPRFVKQFELNQLPKQAELLISGLGFYSCELNGQPVSDQLLNPAFSRYDVTCYFNQFDVTPLLQAGENTLCVTLGNGWYNELQANAWDFDHAVWKHPPQLLAELMLDGVTALGTDSSWQCGPSRTQFNSLRGGETYDAAMELPALRPAVVDHGPGGLLKPQTLPPIRVCERLEPVARYENIYDFGVNTSGNVEVRVRGEKGQRLTIRYGERMREDRSLDTADIDSLVYEKRFQTDEYILSGQGEERWHAQFGYNGFRYVQLEGPCEVLGVTARVFHTDLKEAGRIECSNPLVMKILDAVRRSTLTNFHHMPTDCPQREKNGWTGDAHLSAEQALFHFDMADAYVKWLDDIVDCQRPSGQIPCIVPTSGWGYSWGSGPTWDAVLFNLPHELYRYTGDISYIKRYYPAMARYLDFLERNTEGYISRYGLGDWCPPFEAEECPAEVLLTGYFYRMAGQMAQFAGLLDREEDQTRYQALAQRVRNAFEREFLGKVPDSQTYLSALLYFGLAPDPEETTRRLAALVDAAQGHLLCGIFGAKFILNALTENGRFDVAYRIASGRDYPSWGYMAEAGEGTLWETWRGRSSRNHHMFSEIGAWYFKALAGFNIDEEAPGFRHVRLTPHIPEDISRFNAWHDTPLGRLALSWDEDWLRVTLPQGMTASLAYGGATIHLTESTQLPR